MIGIIYYFVSIGQFVEQGCVGNISRGGSLSFDFWFVVSLVSCSEENVYVPITAFISVCREKDQAERFCCVFLDGFES